MHTLPRLRAISCAKLLFFSTGLFNSLDAFRKLLIVRCIRPDKTLPAIYDFVHDNLGKKWVLWKQGKAANSF
jgi:hypothetical protein